MNDPQILILGIGNTLLADEGFGPAAITYLEQNFIWPSNIQLVDGATRGLMLMSELLECDLAIILDIILMNSEPGTIYKLEGEEISTSFTNKYSMHQTSLEDILINCELVDHRPETIIYAMEPFNYRCLQPFITIEAERLLPKFCSLIIDELAGMGIPIESNIEEK